MATSLYEGQKTYGSYNEQYAHLRESILKVIGAGASSSEEYQATLLQLLRAVNLLEAKNKASLDRLNEMIAYHKAMVNGCSLLGNLILSVVDSRLRQREKILEGARLIEQRELEQDRERVEELITAGKEEEALELEKSISERELAMKTDEVLRPGSEEETKITQQVVKSLVSSIGGGEWEDERAPGGGVFAAPPSPVIQRNPKLFEAQAVQEAISASLDEHKLDEKEIVLEEEAKKKSRKRNKKSSDEQT